MSIKSGDKLPNGNNITEDNYYKVNNDITLLLNRLKIVKNKMSNTQWYKILTRIGLQKELSRIERENNEIGKRLERLDQKNMNPIQIVRRI